MLCYGTVKVTLHPNLTDDQRCSIVQMAVENQLIGVHNRQHYNEIMNQCVEISKLGFPVTVNWKVREYSYTYILEYFE